MKKMKSASKKTKVCRLGRSPLEASSDRNCSDKPSASNKPATKSEASAESSGDQEVQGTSVLTVPVVYYYEQILRLQAAAVLDAVDEMHLYRDMVIELAPRVSLRVKDTLNVCELAPADVVGDRVQALLDESDYKSFQMARGHLVKCVSHLKFLVSHFKDSYKKAVAEIGLQEVRNCMLYLYQQFLVTGGEALSTWNEFNAILAVSGVNFDSIFKN